MLRNCYIDEVGSTCSCTLLNPCNNVWLFCCCCCRAAFQRGRWGFPAADAEVAQSDGYRVEPAAHVSEVAFVILMTLPNNQVGRVSVSVWANTEYFCVRK